MIKYSIITQENLLHCDISGSVKLLDFSNYVNSLVLDTSYHPQLNSIIHVSETTKLNYAKEAVSIGQFFTQYLLLRKGIAWAFVMSSRTTMGLTRLVVDEIDTRDIDVNYFYSEADAKKWIAKLKQDKEAIAV